MHKRGISALLLGCILLSACGQNENIGTLMDGIKEEMSIAELSAALSVNGAAEATYELLEGAGTAYYIGNKYVQIQFDSDRNGEYDRQLLILLDESLEETVNPESAA